MIDRPPKPPDKEPKPRHRKRRGASTTSRVLSDDELLAPLRGAGKGKGFPFMKEGLDDRARVIMAASLIEEWLKVATVYKFRVQPTVAQMKEVFSANGGPLSTFANRIAFAAVMGLVPDGDMRNDLDIIRWIRNQFAHSFIPRSLDDADIAKELNRLKLRTELIKVTFELRPNERRYLESCMSVCVKLIVTTFQAGVEKAILTAEARRIHEALRHGLAEMVRVYAPGASPGKSEPLH